MMISVKLCFLPLVLLLIHSSFTLALLSTSDVNPPYPKAISDLREAIVRGLGLTEEFKITGFDPREAQMGHSVQYEFDVEVDQKVIRFKLLEDMNRCVPGRESGSTRG
ncbi:hypothetical protein L6164_036444 [Bauhinia variegata]|uniref:Uncharacterized protein n=1 Tax=Bauhinia variegata TaxID=167791 RepID=A0ACB9KH22_BAUVA|nr:hypothetical protein L6164_036444 [Bauhinia variegata]